MNLASKPPSMTIAFVALLFAAACEPGGRVDSSSPDTDSGSDSDADGDTDTDSDSDSDSDSDECTPGEVWCQGSWVVECDADNTWNQVEDCAAIGLVCAAGECSDISQQCADAINGKSYIGCDYWAATLANPVEADDYKFAVAIANAGDESAEIRITDGAAVDNIYTVAAGSMEIVEDLPWKMLTKEVGNPIDNNWATRKVANAAYHITSDRPVTVYQFSPLHYAGGAKYSYTNDASLLLPSHIYLDEYVVMSRPTIKLLSVNALAPVQTEPGLFAVVGTAGGPTDLEITVAGNTAASDSLSNEAYSALSPGQVLNVTIQPYEVLQVLSGSEPGCTASIPCGSSGETCCNTPPEYDLTGSVIKVLSGPAPAVFGGTDCSFVPFDMWACDHLEEQLFPLETWGTHYLCPQIITQSELDPTVWRVMSGSDDNDITFNPAGVYPAVTLQKGEYVEFESLTDFEVVATGRLSIAQFMVGQDYSNTTPIGDPSMSLAVPVEQYRTDYLFLAPDTYAQNYLTVIHKSGVAPALDGTPVVGDTVDISGEWARTNLDILPGIHEIASSEPFAITVYGVGNYTSYMYPGGLDLKEIEIVVE